jgi:hypothetical protein
LELYDGEGTLLATVREPGSGLPHFVDQGGHMASDATARLAYSDAAVTADLIYAVYSGRTRKEGGAEAAFGKEIRVFDWNGTLVKRRTVDDILSAIAVDPSDPSFVYAVAFMPDARIVRIPVG